MFCQFFRVLDQRLGLSLNFALFCLKILLKCVKNTEKNFSTSIWSAQHPNIGQIYNTVTQVGHKDTGKTKITCYYAASLRT